MIFNLQSIDLLVILAISLSKFSVGFITGMVIPIFPTLIDKHFSNSSTVSVTDFNLTEISQQNSSFNYQQLSILFATKNLGQILLSPWMGYLCGRLGSLNILLFGVGLQSITILFYGLGSQYYLLLIGRIFEAMASGAINCAVSTFVAFRYTDHRKLGLVYGIGGLGLNIGGASGPAYGGLVFQYYGKIVVFLTVLTMMTMEAVLIILLRIIDKSKNPQCKMINETINITEKNEKIDTKFENEITVSVPNDISISNETENKYFDNRIDKSKFNSCLLTEKIDGKYENQIEIENPKKKHNLLYFFTDPYFMICLGSFPVMFFSLFIYLASLPQFMRMKFQASESQQGVIWLLNLCGYFLGFLLGNFLNTKFSKSRHIVLVGTIYLQSIGAICVALMPTWWSIAIPLCFIVNQHLIFEIVIAPLLASIVTKRHNSQFGIMSGIIMMAIALTSSLGSILGPILLSKIGFLFMNIIVLSIGIIYGPFLLLLKRFL